MRSFKTAMSFYSKCHCVGTTDLSKMDELNQTYNGVILSRLNSEEVNRLSPLLLFLSVIGLCGIPGNITVIYVYRNRWRKSNSKLFFMWLAIIDMLNGSVALPLEFVNVTNQYTYKYEWLCKVTIFATYWLTLTSGITLVIITVDRFRKVCQPLKWQFSNKTALNLCAVSFIGALGLSWPVLFLYGIHTFETNQKGTLGSECSITNHFKGTVYVMIYSVILAIIFTPLFLTTITLYIIIGRKIFKLTNAGKDKTQIRISKSETPSSENVDSVVIETANCKRPSTCEERQISISNKKAKRSALIMFLISLAFILSFVPYLILRSLQTVNSEFVPSMTNTERTVYKTFLRTYWLNCAINPFIYCACAQEFRKECKELWRKILFCRKQ